MSDESKLEKPGPGPGSRYELLIVKDASGFEHLTIERIGKGGHAQDASDSDAVNYSRQKLVDLACRIFETRRERSRFFTNSLLGEPVWDMLLALYCLAAQGSSLTITGLSRVAAVPPTTGLRWTRLMEQKGLVARKRDPNDGRRVQVKMTEKGERLMDEYLTSIFRRLAPTSP